MTPPMYFSRLSRTLSTSGGNLPHWTQRCATFVTFRLADSLPQAKLDQYEAEREEWLRSHGLVDAGPCPRQIGMTTIRFDAGGGPRLRERHFFCDAGGGPRQRERHFFCDAGRGPRLREWDAQTAAEYEELFPLRFQKWLDAGHGSCVLRDERVRALVEESLRHYDGIRYSLYAFVVMPNHVHVLFMPEEGRDGRKIVAEWKSFSARAVNDRLNRQGALWQKESYDHLVRNVDEFNAIRSYIRNNDTKLAWDAYAP